MGFVERVLTEEPASLEQIRSSLKVHYELYVRKFDLEEAMDDLLEIVTNGPYILHVIDFLEYHSFSPFLASANSSIISTYSRTKDLLISSSEAIFSAGIPSL